MLISVLSQRAFDWCHFTEAPSTRQTSDLQTTTTTTTKEKAKLYSAPLIVHHLPSFTCIWFEQKDPLHRFMHGHTNTHTQHKKKTNIQPARFVSTGQKATELVHQVNTPLCRDLVCSDIDAGSLGGGWMGGGADTLAAAAIKESERGSALVSSWLDPTSYRVHGASKFTGRLERLLKSFPPPSVIFLQFFLVFLKLLVDDF